MLEASLNTAHEKFIIQVAQNQCYDLLYNISKNRIYFTIHGFWKSKDSVPEFLDDWTKVLKYVHPGFTVVANLRTMITHPQELKSLHMEAQRKIKAAGVVRVARLMPVDRIASLQIQSIAESTNLPTRKFISENDAEEWLDQATSSLN